MRLMDGLRFSVGTLSIFPVRVERVDRQVSGDAMVLAPAVGLVLGLVAGLPLLLPVPPLLGAALALGLLALLTRGLHLDGLADLADGLGSGKPADEALDIMKKSDIGPFGVMTLVFTLLVQVVALAETGYWALVTACVAGRLALTWACRAGVPAARPDGLGAMVAGTVRRPAAWLATLAALLTAAVIGLLTIPGAGLWAMNGSAPPPEGGERFLTSAEAIPPPCLTAPDRDPAGSTADDLPGTGTANGGPLGNGTARGDLPGDGTAGGDFPRNGTTGGDLLGDSTTGDVICPSPGGPIGRYLGAGSWPATDGILPATEDGRQLSGVVVLPITLLAGTGAALLLLGRARRRLGGITGDVLGALVETATATTLVVCAILS